jgi:Holliday junction DNA helicase RuvA
MISFISGKIINKGNGFIIIKTGDIGYKIFLSPSFFSELEIGQDLDIYTHQYVREEALDLYGFRGLEELEMFEMLLSISGIGPKTALGVLAVGSADQIKESIARGDSALLTKVSGIGKKTAERVVLELREKVGRLELAAGSKEPGGGALNGDEIDALIALGYSLTQARDALRTIDPNIKNSGQRIKEALKKLGR